MTELMKAKERVAMLETELEYWRTRALKMGVLQKLSNYQLNASISAFQDVGFEAKLGDEIDGYKAVEILGTFGECEKFLENAAIVNYPELQIPRN